MRKIVYDRHARRRMHERAVTESEVEAVMATPEYIEPSVKGRMNAFHFINGRYLRIHSGKKQTRFWQSQSR